MGDSTADMTASAVRPKHRTFNASRPHSFSVSSWIYARCWRRALSL